MLNCRICKCNCDPSDLINGVCDDCRAEEETRSYVNMLAKSNDFEQLEMSFKGVNEVREIVLKRLELINFKGTKHRVVEFGKRAFAKGKNACGKTTLYNAVLWVLFDKDINGNSATNVRPHDENGVDIDNIDISVSATFEVDGREITLNKMQRQKWSTDRSTGDTKLAGNDNLYEINGIPKKLKDYKAFIDENFVKEETFFWCSNVGKFFSLGSKDRRNTVTKLAGFTDDMIIEKYPEFESIRSELAFGTLDENIQKHKWIINGKGKDDKGLKGKQDSFKYRIDEQEKSKVDIDTAELELGKNALNETIAKKRAELDDLSSKYAEYEQASTDLLSLKFDLNDIQRQANDELFKKKRQLEATLLGANLVKRDTENAINSNKRDVDDCNNRIADCEKLIKQQADKWKMVNARKIDDSALVCPYCKQELTAEVKAKNRENFEIDKKKDLAQIESEGNFIREQISQHKLNILNLNKEIEDLEDGLQTTNKHIKEYEYQLRDYPSSVDVSDREDYKALKKQIAEKEQFISKCSDVDGLRQSINDELFDLQHKLENVNSQLAKSQWNVNCDERIEELQAELRATNQKIADEERMLYLLETFNKKKMEMLTESVNKHFSIVKFKLFEEQINGGYADCCKVIVNGSDYERGLNHGDRILADIDILNTFQKMNDVKLPIWVDDSESVDEDRLPELDTQMIVLRRTDDKELVVE